MIIIIKSHDKDNAKSKEEALDNENSASAVLLQIWLKIDKN